MVDKVLDFGKKLLERFKEWWNKFQPKQKTLLTKAQVSHDVSFLENCLATAA